jgi:hypothetical protein
MKRPTILLLLHALVAAGTCLPSRCLAPKGGIILQTHRLMGNIYEVCCSVGLRCHDMHTRFHRNWFRRSKFGEGGLTDTQRAWRLHKHTSGK